MRGGESRNTSYNRYTPRGPDRDEHPPGAARDDVRFPSRRDRDGPSHRKDEPPLRGWDGRQAARDTPKHNGDHYRSHEYSGGDYAKGPHPEDMYSRAREREQNDRPRNDYRDPPHSRSRDHYYSYDRYDDRSRNRARENGRDGEYRGYGHNGSRARNDRNDRKRREDHRGDTQQRKPKNYKDEEDTLLSKDELIEKYEGRLQGLAKVKSLEEREVPNSLWGVRRKGFEDVSAQEAKVSGLFPIPGNSVAEKDAIEENLTDKFNHATFNSLMMSHSYKIEPLESRTAKTVIIKGGVALDSTNYTEAVKYFNKFLARLDLDETSLDNVVDKRLSKSSNTTKLIIQFATSRCATICIAAARQGIPRNELLGETGPGNELVYLDMVRPEEYVSHCLPPYQRIDESEVLDRVIDSPREITLIVDEAKSESELIEVLRSVAPVRAFQLLREVGTKKSTGLAFVEFYFDPEKHKNTFTVVSAMEKLIEQINGWSDREDKGILSSFLSCVVPGKTGIQNCPIDVDSLKAMANGEYVTNHGKLTVIQLINIISAHDLVDNDKFSFIQQDILKECRKFGEVVSIRIPRPKKDQVGGTSLTTAAQPGLGRVYVEYQDSQQALNAIMGLAGRMYNDKTVICAFHSQEDYIEGLL